ncbi:hypothetical protein [Entomospira culicis]|uniref:Uncharacterized protein n=1 Tax=Entomospira culicis TaxID=2719989 RepID=A0A968GEU9_9SPIO|nr:hypothetical protein [Entomospira culicis]NIZ18998.1 hypothetical protein [Entomospira culicis]NIZ69213.1 hypothetical protein [Entomospira culicis]WDI37799.1 hypothetical protein PVA46_03160 [Entomospira culicis]WDI39427.1 hypothetical protein PVA47_03165 [Entomospira culicis]
MGLLARAESVIAERRRREYQPIMMSADSTAHVTENKLQKYVEQMEDADRRVYVLELNTETLLDELTKQSDDPVQESEILQQWSDMLYELLGKDSFVLHVEKNQYVIIHSSDDSMIKSFLVSGIVRFASDVFGVEAEESWFVPSFYSMNASAMERFAVWIQ